MCDLDTEKEDLLLSQKQQKYVLQHRLRHDVYGESLSNEQYTFTIIIFLFFFETISCLLRNRRRNQIIIEFKKTIQMKNRAPI